jgi:non-specific serine/threonine protein kinase/serine/threonine-protein kinase
MRPPDGDTTTAAGPGGAPGRIIGPYRLLRLLGAGGMGEVWLAEQSHPVHRLVALKVIKPGMDSRQVIARFEAERQALALMVHPTIAAVFDGGTTDEGRPYFAMEYVQGEPITTYCDRHRLSVRERLALFEQVCEGVHYAHQKGIIHRDLKPSNILVTVLGERVVPKIIDFGVAKATAQPLTERTLFTELGVLIGTPEYMSPEQAEMGALDVDTRTDIYALGVIFYELLTGHLPIERSTLRQAGLDGIRKLIREQDPPKPSTRVTRLGPTSGEFAHNRQTEPGRLARLLRGDLDWIAMKALEKDRTRRYGSASDFASDIRRHLLSQPVLAGPPSAAYRLRKFVRRHPAGLAVSGITLILLVAFAVAMAVQARRVAAERDVAATERERAERERDRAEQVSAFLVSLFQASDPDRAKGESLTARDLLDRGVLRLQSELKDQPQTRATLLHTIGTVYGALGRGEAARKVLEEALSLRRSLTGRDRADLAETLNALGNSYGLDNLDRTEALYREALQLRRETLGPDHVKVAHSLTNIGNLLYDRGRVAESEQHYREALAIASRGSSPVDIATIQIGLSRTVFNLGREQEGFDLLRNSVALLRQALGVENSRTLTAMNNLARQLYFARSSYDEVATLQREVLQARRKMYGAEHTEVARALFVLGDTLSTMGRSAEGEEVLRESVAMYRRLQSRPSVDLAWVLNALAGHLNRVQRYDEAEKTFRECLDVFRRATDDAPGDVGVPLQGLGELLVKQGQVAEAEKLLRESVSVRQAAGVPAFLRAFSQNALGQLLCDKGDAEEGLALLEAAMKTLRPATEIENAARRCAARLKSGR